MLLVLLTPGRWPYPQDFSSQLSPRLPVSLGLHPGNLFKLEISRQDMMVNMGA